MIEDLDLTACPQTITCINQTSVRKSKLYIQNTIKDNQRIKMNPITQRFLVPDQGSPGRGPPFSTGTETRAEPRYLDPIQGRSKETKTKWREQGDLSHSLVQGSEGRVVGLHRRPNHQNKQDGSLRGQIRRGGGGGGEGGRIMAGSLERSRCLPEIDESGW